MSTVHSLEFLFQAEGNIPEEWTPNQPALELLVEGAPARVGRMDGNRGLLASQSAKIRP